MSKKQWFKWTVEIEVHRTWVEDGFDLTSDRAHAMLARELSHAYGHELRAKTIKAPNPAAIREAQGYTGANAKKYPGLSIEQTRSMKR